MDPQARRTYAIGLGVRLFGALLIWLGDGSAALWRKAIVVFGVVLSVGGIGVLKFLLYQGLKKKRRRLSLPSPPPTN